MRMDVNYLINFHLQSLAVRQIQPRYQATARPMPVFLKVSLLSLEELLKNITALYRQRISGLQDFCGRDGA